LKWFSGLFQWSPRMTASGSVSRKTTQIRGPGATASSVGAHPLALNLVPPSATRTSTAKSPNSPADYSHWSGQGSSLLNRDHSTCLGSKKAIHGRLRSRRNQGPWYLVLLLLAFGPLLGCLMTLLTLGSLMPSKTALPLSNSLSN